MTASPIVTAAQARKALALVADPVRAEGAARFFKTGKGEYGEGDVFVGVSVPKARTLAKRGISMPDEQIRKLLTAKEHEARFLALVIWTLQFKRGDSAQKRAIYTQYLAHTKHINNWDLVDVSAYEIVGPWLRDKPRTVLRVLARSPMLWERRIAIVCTLAFIRAGELTDTFDLCVALKGDREDLIHKACGWMLREAGKRDIGALRDFLRLHAATLPRTTLRYAIERMSKAEQAAWRSATPPTST